MKAAAARWRILFVWFPLLSQEERRCDGNLILPCLMVDERQSAGTRLWHAEGAIRYFDLFIDLVRGLAGGVVA